MKNEGKKNIIFIIAVAFCIVLSGNIYSSVKSLELGRHLDTARNELIRAEEYNRNLTERLGSISANVQKLGDLTERNVSGVRECIELIEETRVIVKELEDCCNSFNYDDYYEYYDSYYHDEGLIE